MGFVEATDLALQMIPFLIEQYSQGNFPLEKLVQTYRIEDFQTAIEDMKVGKVIKPVLVWRS
jgi:Zn-dependent alcohol dehydrogenase